jgi:hypothetical protein
MEFDITLRGEPATVVVTAYCPDRPGQSSGNPDTWYPEENGFLDFEVFIDGEMVCDLTDAEIEAIEQDALDLLEYEADRMAGYYEQGELWA